MGQDPTLVAALHYRGDRQETFGGSRCNFSECISATREKLLLSGRPSEIRRATMAVKPRTAELVLVTPHGSLIGSLPAVPVATPWWQDVEPVVRAARDHHGVDIIVLRLLDVLNWTNHLAAR
jgi:hypothetical protein